MPIEQFAPGRLAAPGLSERYKRRAEGTTPQLLQRWGIWLAVEGDLRFLSHLDVARAVERTAVRAQLPLKYSRGFNPRPSISWAAARPVGVATRGDLLVITLAGPIEANELMRRMNRQGPAGLRVLRAEPLTGTKTPRPRQMTYELPLTGARVPAVRARLEQLAGAESWLVERLRPPRRRQKSRPPQQIDLKGLVAEIKLHRRRLRMKLIPRGDLWARPGEVLRLVGLDERADLADTVRTDVAFDPECR